MPVYLSHPVFALGQQEATLADAVELGRVHSGYDVLADAGFRKHYRCLTNESPYALARRAVEKFDTTLLTDVDIILYNTCLPLNASVGDVQQFHATGDVKSLMDFPASRLQAEFGLQQATVIGVTQEACTGVLGSLRLAKALLAEEPELRRILCITADRFPESLSSKTLYEQAYNLISDGAAGCLVSCERIPNAFSYRVVATHAKTNGALVQASDDETVGTFFNYALAVMQETLQKAGVSPQAVRWILPQNTNIKAWQILAKLLGIPFERVYCPSLPEIGHMISGDNLANLAYLETAAKQDSSLLQAGDYLLCFMAGYGLNWQCCLLEVVG